MLDAFFHTRIVHYYVLKNIACLLLSYLWLCSSYVHITVFRFSYASLTEKERVDTGTSPLTPKIYIQLYATYGNTIHSMKYNWVLSYVRNIFLNPPQSWPIYKHPPTLIPYGSSNSKESCLRGVKMNSLNTLGSLERLRAKSPVGATATLALNSVVYGVANGLQSVMF